MHWQSVGIIGKPRATEQSLMTVQQLYYLLHDWGITTYYEQTIAQSLKLPQAQSRSCDALMKDSDLILVVGGDGSMLRAASAAITHNKPLLGVNRGHLGFLTDIGPEELNNRLHKVLTGAFWLEERLLLQGGITRNDKMVAKHCALNDIVLSHGVSAQLIEFDLWVNNTFVCRQRADGLIITTPTGSTAYALSAGGPIVHPELDALAIVPMLPHKLTSRPIIIRSDAQIKIVLSNTQEHTARISFDSHECHDINTEDVIHINQYPKKLSLVHPCDYNYFQTLRDKLHWESR